MGNSQQAPLRQIWSIDEFDFALYCVCIAMTTAARSVYEGVWAMGHKVPQKAANMSITAALERCVTPDSRSQQCTVAERERPSGSKIVVDRKKFCGNLEHARQGVTSDIHG